MSSVFRLPNVDFERVRLKWKVRRGKPRTSLVMTSIRERRTNPDYELEIENRGDEPVDLHEATVYDTRYTRYNPIVEVVIAPGHTKKFTVPRDFELESTDETIVKLGSFSIEKGLEAPLIVTRDEQLYMVVPSKRRKTDTAD